MPAPTSRLSQGDDQASIDADIAAIGRISAVPALLRILCDNTGMGFAAVARVTEGTWTACAVQDNIQFGLKAGGQLDVKSTLCSESRAMREPIVIDHASRDPVYCNHHTPRIYRIESYVSVPIVLSNGDYFGNLCAIDPHPAKVSDPRTVAMFTAYAELVARQLESEQWQEAATAALLAERERAVLREEFIAVLGHDLRNPLAAVSGMAELLARRATDMTTIDIAQRMRKATRRMSLLIDDVLDLTRGRLGTGIGLQLAEATDLVAALHDVVTELRLAYPDRQVIESIEADLTMRCDRGRLQQLLSNLLGNALTHGAPDRPVHVTASMECDILMISVANEGTHISADNLAKVFEPYWRASAGRTDGGLGLGLHICSQIVKAHEGTLTVTSTADEGTRFTARLPRRGPAPV